MASTPYSPPASRESLEEGFVWIRADTFSPLLLGGGAFLWLFLNVQLAGPGNAWPGWGVPLGLLIATGLCAVLRDQNYRLAALLYTASLLLGTCAFLVTPSEETLVPFLVVPVVLVAGTVLGSRSAFITAAIVSGVILASGSLLGREISTASTVGALSVIWLTALTAWVTTRSLYTALHWAWTNSEHAAARLEEARLYQGQLAAANRQLEEANYRLEQANYALAWARAEAEEARRLKAQFAAHISHELRTPINLIVGFTELMLSDPRTYDSAPLPKPYQTDLTAVYRSARHLQALIDDILDLSQIDAGEMPVLLEVTDVGATVHEAVAAARSLLDRKGLSLEVALAPDLPLLYLDRVRIRQVVLNLLNNAVRFTDRGGASIRAFRDGETVVVEVADTGVGIRPEDLSTLFEPFHQLDLSPTRSRGGTGLGLAISKRFVELHGGRIWATSEGVPGKGSVFSFALPIQIDQSPARHFGGRSEAPHQVRAAASAPTVVVLDDDPAVVSLYQRHLVGYRVTGAASTEQAIALATELKAHAIITDLPETGMTESDAPEGWLYDWTDLAAKFCIRVLGCPIPSGRRMARSLGMVDHLVKPVSRDALLRSVSEVAPQAQKILVVDDEPQMARLLCRLLGSSNREYQLLRAADGQQALEMMHQHRPDLVLLDLLMPQVDGRTVVEQMRQDPALASLPVIAVSGKGIVETIIPCSARALVVISDEVLPTSRLVQWVQTALDALPPAGTAPQGRGQSPQ